MTISNVYNCLADLIRSVIETIGMPCSVESFLKLVKEAIAPSSLSITAVMTETGRKPASVTKSTEASVWPALLRTPPFRYFKGKIWPGFLKSSGLDSRDESARTVFALSEADTPVETPAFAS